MGSIKKPPIGIKLKWLHDEERFENVRLGIFRYIISGIPVPPEWIEEYNHPLSILPPYWNACQEKIDELEKELYEESLRYMDRISHG